MDPSERQRRAQAFLAEVLAHPADPSPLLMWADWLTEGGGDEHFVYTLRWMAGRGKRPHRRGNIVREPWVWLRNGMAFPLHFAHLWKHHPHAVLPRALFDRQRKMDTWMLPFPTWYAAVWSLMGALRELREVVSTDPPARPGDR